MFATGSGGWPWQQHHLPSPCHSVVTLPDKTLILRAHLFSITASLRQLSVCFQYGFGDPNTAMVEGLTMGGDSQTLDFATVVRRMKVQQNSAPALATLVILLPWPCVGSGTCLNVWPTTVVSLTSMLSQHGSMMMQAWTATHMHDTLTHMYGVDTHAHAGSGFQHHQAAFQL